MLCIKDFEGDILFYDVISKKRDDMIFLFLEYYVDLTIINNNGFNLLYYVVLRGNFRYVIYVVSMAWKCCC